jgi:predicted dehydrogenase
MSKPLSKLCVAVVGYGSIGRRHTENLARLGVSRRVVVRRVGKTNTAFEVPAEVQVVCDTAAVLEVGLDAVIICVPTRLHVETALPYLEAGVPVLVEKPISDDVIEAATLVETARRENVLASMAYCMRYHPAYTAARRALGEGRIGRVLYAKAWFESYLPDWHPWEDYRQSYAARTDLGGGVLPTLDHELDFLNWCLGQPETVVGWSAQTGGLETEAADLAALSIHYPGGVAATAHLSLCRRDRSRGFEFVGLDGTLTYHQETGRLEIRRQQPPDSEVLCRDSEAGVETMYLEMLRDFLMAVTADGQLPAPVPLEAGLAALRVAAATGPQENIRGSSRCRHSS